MIYLLSGEDNNAIVTLYEATTNLVNPHYTWKLENKTTKVETIFTSEDNSDAPWSYNSFTISVATYSGLTAGIINCPVGEYEYIIYEMPDNYNLNIASASGIVEYGILKIVGTTNGMFDLNAFTYSGTIPAYNKI
jgi:hypothetical protein